MESKPNEYLYGEHPAVETQHTLEERIIAGDPTLKDVKTRGVHPVRGVPVRRAALLLQDLLRGSVRLSERLREINPDVKNYILYRDLRTYGLLEKFYTESRRAGTIFVRYDPEAKPRVEAAGDKVNVVVRDLVLDEDITIPADLLDLGCGHRPG